MRHVTKNETLITIGFTLSSMKCISQERTQLDRLGEGKVPKMSIIMKKRWEIKLKGQCKLPGPLEALDSGLGHEKALVGRMPSP